MSDARPTHPDVQNGLALALIAAADTPTLLLDGDLIVHAVSRSFGDVFGIDAAGLAGQPLAAVGDGQWAGPQLASLLRATAAGSTDIGPYEMDASFGDRATCDFGPTDDGGFRVAIIMPVVRDD